MILGLSTEDDSVKGINPDSWFMGLRITNNKKNPSFYSPASSSSFLFLFAYMEQNIQFILFL